jgi:CheY-like chemotaxis protein
MDHKMPEMDGIECMHAIKKQEGGFSRDSKIIALTANAGSDVEALYAREGFDGYLMKPITGKELESALYRALPRDLITSVGSTEALVEESMAWITSGKTKRAVKITTESVADIPGELLKKYNIAVLPHMVETSRGLFKDGLELDTRGLLEYMKNDNALMFATPPSVEEHERFFSDQLDEANNIIHISISEKVEQSGCTTARKAADGFGNVSVIDSRHLSTGQGLMAIEAARLAAYHSKARESTNVPVDYTLVKYVSKPNGAKPGMVIYVNNKTVFVDPKCDI